MNRIILYRPFLFLVVFFSVLDGMRDTFFSSFALSSIKELSVLLLFIFVFFGKREHSTKTGRFLFVFNCLMALLVCWGFLTTFFNTIVTVRTDALSLGGYSVLIKVIDFWLLTNALVMLSTANAKLHEYLKKWYIAFVVLYCVLTILFVFTGLRASLPPRNWFGRLSIGYPTMDAFIIGVGLLFLFDNHKIGSTAFRVLFFLFSLVLFMQNTATGALIYLLVMLKYFIVAKGRQTLFPVFLVVGLIAAIAYIYILARSEFGAFGSVVVDKINGFIFGYATSSISARADEMAALHRLIYSDYFSPIIGLGGVAGYMVESQYSALLGLSGWFGLTCFFVLNIYMAWYFAIKNKRIDLIILQAAYLTVSLSLISFYLFPLLFIYAYLISSIGFEKTIASKRCCITIGES